MHKISVIVPVYNVEQYLRKCIESILSQTYSNIEIILVNDGSTDKSLQICKEYAIKDKRIVIYDKRNNTGLSDARNKGIDIATGDYLVFVDSDDWINKNMIEVLYYEAFNNNACITQCNFIRIFDDKKTYVHNDTNNVSILQSKEALEKIYTLDSTRYTVVWNKIYKKNMFKDIRFPLGKLHEDEFITYKLFDKANKIVNIDTAMYYYRQRKGSITNSSFNKKRLDVLEALNQRIDYFSKKGYKKLKLKTVNQLQYSLRNCYFEIYYSSIDGKDELYQKIKKQIIYNYLPFITNRYISMKSKVAISMILIDGSIYCKLFRKYNRRNYE